MPTKEDLSEEINDALGTDIEWQRLLEEDLEHLHGLVMNGDLMEPVTKQYIKEHGKARFEKEVDEWHPGKILGRMV